MSVQKTASLLNTGTSSDENQPLPTLESLWRLYQLVQTEKGICHNDTKGTMTCDEHWRLLLQNLLRDALEQRIQSQNKVMANQPPVSSIQQQPHMSESLEPRHGSTQSPVPARPTNTTTESPSKTRKKRKDRHDNKLLQRHHEIAMTSPQTELKERRKQAHKSSKLSGKLQSSQSLKLNRKDRIGDLQQFDDSNMLFRQDDQKKGAERDGTVKKISAICDQRSVSGDSGSSTNDSLTDNLIFTHGANAVHYKLSREIPSHLNETLNLKQLDSSKAIREVLDQKKAHIHPDGAYQEKREPFVHRENKVKGAVNHMQFSNAPASHRSNSDNHPCLLKAMDSKHVMHNQKLLSSVANTRTAPVAVASTWMNKKIQGKQHDKAHDGRKSSAHTHKKVLVPLHRSRSSHNLDDILVESSSSHTEQESRESESGSQSSETMERAEDRRKPNTCRALASPISRRSIKASGLQHQQIRHREKETCSPQQHLKKQIVVNKLPSKTPFRMNKENCLVHQQRRHPPEDDKTHSPHHQNLTKKALVNQLPNQKAFASDKRPSHMSHRQNKGCNSLVQSDNRSELHPFRNAKEKLRRKIFKNKDKNMNDNDSEHVGTFQKCKDKLAHVFHRDHPHDHQHGSFLSHLLHLGRKNEVGKKLANNKKPMHKKEHGHIYKILAVFLRHILHPRRTRAKRNRLGKAKKMMARGRLSTKVHRWQTFYKKPGVRLANRKKPHLRISTAANPVRRLIKVAKH